MTLEGGTVLESMRVCKSTESLGEVDDGLREDERIHARPREHHFLKGSVSVPPLVYASCWRGTDTVRASSHRETKEERQTHTEQVI